MFDKDCPTVQVPYFWAGIKAYDLVSGSECLKSSYFLNKERALELFPMLKKNELCGAIVYYDGRFQNIFNTFFYQIILIIIYLPTEKVYFQY